MRYLPPIPWRAVVLGTVVLDRNGVARAVIGNMPGAPGQRLVLLEGDPSPHYVGDETLISPIELDEADAAAVLRAAGLVATPVIDRPTDQQGRS